MIKLQFFISLVKFNLLSMSVFNLYFELGISHIADIQGYDHILFLITLSAVYTFRDWKKVIILITAFTIGHCATLVLATFNYILINSDFIEFLIPVTILITALANIIQKDQPQSKSLHMAKYFAALFFGLIHGLGFSNYLKSLLGSAENIIKPLFAFNLGIELGQIFIVTVFLFLSAFILRFTRLNKQDWNLIMSGAGLGISLILILERYPF